MSSKSRLRHFAMALGLGFAASLAAESAITDESSVSATKSRPIEEVLVRALRLKTDTYPATILQWAVAGEGALIAHERLVKHVQNTLPITEHQVESLRDNTKLLGLPVLAAE
jgi:hypothetical protein